MSDDKVDNNKGTSLPHDVGATHNIGLSPLFSVRIGWAETNNNNEPATVWRAIAGYLWSATARDRSWAYYLAFGESGVFPSPKLSRILGFSLRCLVSTNNT